VVPDAKAYGMSRGLNFRRSVSLIQVTTDEGVVGCGEAAGPALVTQEYFKLVRPAFIGRDIFAYELVATHVYNKLYHLGVQNQMTSSLGAINIALYDAIGRTLGVPVYNLLGGAHTDRIPAYASTGYLSKDPDNQLGDQLERIAGQGFPGVKIKIGVSPASDVERVRLTRKILGDDILVMVDVNGNYTRDIALESMRRLEPFGIHWMEEPLPLRDTEGFRLLRQQAPISIATGEAAYTVEDFRRVVDARGVDILQPALPTCGGFSQGRQIAALAAQNNLRVSPHVWGGAIGLAAALHFMAALPPTPHSDNIPYPPLLEYDRGDNPLRDQLLTTPIVYDRGAVRVPEGPGLGVELDMAVVDRYRIR
jgi:D-galactarolactone cycloisomerase